jgi:cation transport ATPase
MRVRADLKRGVVRISGKPLAEAARLATRRELIDRFFNISSLRAMRLDASRGTAWLSFDVAEISVPEALEALAAALRAPAPPRLALPHGELLLADSPGQPLEVRRAERGLTLWKLEEINAGRFRLSHPLLRRPPIRERVLDALAGLAGVTGQSTTLLRPESVEVRCQPHRVTFGILLDVLESALADYASIPVTNGLPLRESLVTANLALAPISDFLFPPLGFVNALLVWTLNVDHLPEAVRGLRARRFNLELLYLCIGAFTLLSFSFFGASVMYAALELWPKLVRKLRVFGERQFLARFRRRPQRVWIERDGALLETALAELPAGEIVVMREGDIVPGDGVVLEGSSGEVLESWISGAIDPVRKMPGDLLFASTELCEGEIRMRIDATGERTAAARLASWFGQALRQPSLKIKSERMAESMVLPVLIFGVAALGRGGIPMAKAVLRPDYFTGPAIAEELSHLITIIQAADAGFYIADESILDRLAESDCWIFDDSVPWKHGTNGAESFAAKLRSQGVGQVIFLSSQSPSDTARLANDLGFDVYSGGVSPEAKKALIAQRQSLGQSIAYFGDSSSQAIVAEQANIAVSVVDRRRLAAPASPAALLIPDLARCGVLHSLSRARSSSVSSAFVSSFIPNFAAMTGAIYFDFSVLSSVVLTNLGTLVSYYRWRRALQSAQ